jgi:hypothetical protein
MCLLRDNDHHSVCSCCFQIVYNTAILIIIDARYHDYNGFPVVNWYPKPLKADNGRQLL